MSHWTSFLPYVQILFKYITQIQFSFQFLSRDRLGFLSKTHSTLLLPYHWKNAFYLVRCILKFRYTEWEGGGPLWNKLWHIFMKNIFKVTQACDTWLCKHILVVPILNLYCKKWIESSLVALYFTEKSNWNLERLYVPVVPWPFQAPLSLNWKIIFLHLCTFWHFHFLLALLGFI